MIRRLLAEYTHKELFWIGLAMLSTLAGFVWAWKTGRE